MTTILNNEITRKDNLEENFSRTKQFVQDNSTVKKIAKVVLFPFSAACIVALAIRDGIDIALYKKANTILSRTEYIKKHSKEFLSKYGATILALGTVSLLSYFTYNSLRKEDLEKIEQAAGGIFKQDHLTPTDTSSLTGIVTSMASIDKLTYGDFIVNALSISSIVVSLLAANLNLDDFHKEIHPTIPPKSNEGVKEKPVEDPLKSSSALESNSQTDEMTKRISQLEQDLETTKQRVSKEIDKSNKLQKALDQKIVESDQDKETIKQLQAELSTSKETIEKLTEDLVNLQQSKAAIDATRLEALQESSGSDRKDIKKIGAILSEILSYITPEVFGIKAPPQSLFDQLSSEPPEPLELANTLRKRVHQLLARLNDLESSLKEPQELLEERPDASSSNQPTEIVDQLRKAQEIASKSEARANQLKEALEKALEEIKDLRNKQSSAESAADSARDLISKELETKTEKLKTTEEKVHQLESQLTTLNIQLSNIKKSAKEERNKILESKKLIEKELETARKERAELEKTKAGETNDLQEKNRSLEDEKARLKASLTEGQGKDDEIERLALENFELRKSYSLLNGQLEETIDLIAKKENTISKLQKALDEKLDTILSSAGESSDDSDSDDEDSHGASPASFGKGGSLNLPILSNNSRRSESPHNRRSNTLPNLNNFLGSYPGSFEIK